MVLPSANVGPGGPNRGTGAAPTPVAVPRRCTLSQDPVGAGLPAMQAVTDRALSRASPLLQYCDRLYHSGVTIGVERVYKNAENRCPQGRKALRTRLTSPRALRVSVPRLPVSRGGSRPCWRSQSFQRIRSSRTTQPSCGAKLSAR